MLHYISTSERATYLKQKRKKRRQQLKADSGAELSVCQESFTCMCLSVLGIAVFREEVSSSKQNISSWVWSAEKITWKHLAKASDQFDIQNIILYNFKHAVLHYKLNLNQFCNGRPLSAPAAAGHRSAESSRNCGGRSWPSWGREEAWLLQWSASLRTVCETPDTSLKSREQHRHTLILTDVITRYKSINWLYVPKCVYYPWEVEINVQQLHLFIDTLAVQHAVTCRCYKNNLIALFISLLNSCQSLRETKREDIQVMISPAWMFPHLMCEFNLRAAESQAD